MEPSFKCKKKAILYGFLMALSAIILGLVWAVIAYNLIPLKRADHPILYAFLITAISAGIFEEFLRHFFSRKIMKDPLFDATKMKNFFHVLFALTLAFTIIEDIQTIFVSPGSLVARLVSFPFHFCMAVFMAILLYEGKVFLAWLAPIILHTLWDGLVFSLIYTIAPGGQDTTITPALKSIIILLILYIILLYGSSLVLYLKYRKREKGRP